MLSPNGELQPLLCLQPMETTGHIFDRNVDEREGYKLMANLPPIKRLTLEDFPADPRKWLGPMFLVLNSFMDGVINALNKDLTLAANSTSDLKPVTLSAVPTASSPVSFTWSKTSRPVSVVVGNTTRVDGAAFTLSAAVQVQWAFVTPSTLQITNVVGITPSDTNQYILQLVIIAG